jgi:hypothetical protein
MRQGDDFCGRGKGGYGYVALHSDSGILNMEIFNPASECQATGLDKCYLFRILHIDKSVIIVLTFKG